ncbi:MAG TPA: TraM recognition domain-containing protein [Streptosporangiaceae bacterium]|nr:TraM recognition domain-containing protein [Streptosporangiaceae bacterium]
MLHHLIHHPIEALIALGVLLALAVVVRIVIGNPNGARRRVRILRWRIRLYLRPGPGYANLLELVIRWSRLRAVWTGRRSRPSLPWWARLMLPVTGYGVRLGRAHFGRRVIASMEDQMLVLAAPRTGKSGWLADRIIDHPGAVVSTTTRTDLFENTALLRGQYGVLHVFNPEGIGGVPSTFRWNPLQGCEHPAIALQRAASFTAATESKGLHDMTFWIGKASSVLASLLHAAALDGRAMNDVYQWAHGIDDAVPEQILAAHPGAAGGWLGPIREVRKPGRTADSIRMTVTRALAWLADPAVAEATSPGTGEGFDVADFVSGRNTLYMIGSRREEAPIAPLFRAFAEYVHARAAFAGSLQPYGRLDPPMLMALDEVTQICPVPLPLWMADSAGKGILIVAVCHGLAQLEARWDSAGARAIWDTVGIKVILGGVADPDTLDRLSLLCGEIALRTHSRTHDEDGRRARTITYQPVRVLPPELLRTLPEWRALVVHGNLSPVVVRLRMAWRRQDYRHARRTAGAPRRSLPTAEAAHPEVEQMEWPGSDPVGELIPLPRDGESWHSGELELQPDEWDAPTVQPNAGGSQAAPRWTTPPDQVPPPSPGEYRPPRPRRPWDPPAGLGNSK